MRRKKRLTIRLVAVGFAVTALAAPAAQAIPEGMQGSDLRALHSDGNVVVSPDDRVIHGTNPQVIKSPDDRPIHGTTSVEPQPVSADDGTRFDVSSGALTGIVLGALLAAVMAAYATHQIRKAGKLASV